MTVESDISKSGPYSGNGATTIFDYDFLIVNENHIEVIRTDALGNETVLMLGADYTVSDVGTSSGGSITTAAAPAAGQEITILRKVPFVQDMDLQNQGAYYAETIERAFDLAVMRDQQLQEQIARAIKVPASTDPSELEALVSDILRVADHADDLDTISANIGNIATVAGGMADVSAVAGNLTEILDAATRAEQARDDAEAFADSVNPELLLHKNDNLSGLANPTTALGNLGATAIGLALFLAQSMAPAQAATSKTLTGFTRQEAAALTIPAGITSVDTVGRTAVGVGGARYKRVGAEPAHAGKFQSADGAWFEYADRAVYVEAIGDISTSAAAAQANAQVVNAAYGCASALGLPIFHPDRKTIPVEDYDADTYALLFDKDDVQHFGNGTVYKNTNPGTSCARIGPSAALTSPGNGRRWTSGQSFRGLTFDNGLLVQRIANASGEEGNADGWTGLATGSIISDVSDTYGRALKATLAAAGDGVGFAFPTVVGQKYWISCRILGATGSGTNIYVAGSASTSLNTSIVNKAINTETDPLLRISLEFTATSTTSYFLIRGNSSSPAGAQVFFRDVYAFQQQDESLYPTPCVIASGMQDTTFENCVFQNSGHYAFGAQNGGYVRNTFQNCTFRDCYMDGLDCKNNGNIGRGNKIDNCRFLRTSLKETAANPSAALDLSAGWDVSNISIELIGCNLGQTGGAGLRFKQGELGDTSARGEGGKRNSASNVRVTILGKPVSELRGYHSQNSETNMAGLQVRGAVRGILLEGEGSQVSAFNLAACTYGLQFAARRCTASAGMIQATSEGVRNQVQTATLAGVHISTPGTGVIATAGTLGIVGGSINAPTESSGAGTIVKSGVYTNVTP